AIQASAPIAGCTRKSCVELPQHVYPTSFYEADICNALFLILWSHRKNLHEPGRPYSMYPNLTGIERIQIEHIHVIALYHAFGMEFTQDEMISLFLILGGIAGIFWSISIYKKNKKELKS